jgi:phosphatidate cytidylyltransferase
MVRLVSGIVLVVVFFTLIWFTNTTILLFVAIAVAALAVHEYVQLFRPLGAHVPAVPTMFATWAALVIVAVPPVSLGIGPEVLLVAVPLIAIWSMVALKAGPEALREAALGAAAAAMSPLYIGTGLGSLVATYTYGGRGAVLLLMATIVVSDTAQYYSGRTFGRHPLSPALSPKKTIEGAIGGFVIAPLFLVLAAPFVITVAVNPIVLAGVGVVLVIAGISGDLFESMLKRAAGVKDSSALIPGHGGVLDRIDAMLFASPVFYLYLRGVVG